MKRADDLVNPKVAEETAGLTRPAWVAMVGARAVVTGTVLVLNQNYEPLNVCNVRRAFVLVDRGKAEIIENGRGYLHSPTAIFEIPSVIRLIYLIRRPRPTGRLTRRDVFLRDRFPCQYCGQQK